MNRVEIKPKFICTHPDAKNDGCCPAADGKGWQCVSQDANGDPLICCYLEVEQK